MSSHQPNQGRAGRQDRITSPQPHSPDVQSPLGDDMEGAPGRPAVTGDKSQEPNERETEEGAQATRGPESKPGAKI